MERSESRLHLINHDVIGNGENYRDDSSLLTESTYAAIIQHFTVTDRPERRQVMVFKEHDLPTDFLLPEFSDVVLLVGRDKVPVYGLRAILTCRSRVFFQEFLKLEKRNRSTKTSSLSGNKTEGKRLRFLVPDYQPVVIKRLVQYLHSGKIQVNSNTIVGLYCAAEEFELPELSEFCRKYMTRGSWKQKISIIMDWIHFYGNKKGAQAILKKVLAVLPKKTSSSQSHEDELRLLSRK